MRRANIAALALFLLAAGCGESADALASRGLAQAKDGRIEAAIETFEQALNRDEKHPKALYNIAIALLHQGRAQDAASRLRTFVQARPDDALGHFSLARAELASGNTEPALQALRNAVLHGFAEPDALDAAGFDRLASDLRYVQLEAVVAQRAGGIVPAPSDGEFAGRTGDGYGGERLGQPMALPGTRINAPNCPDGDAAACL